MKAILAALALAVVSAACGGGGGATTSTAMPTATTPTATANATPTGEVRHSGVPEVDAIIDAVLSGDADQIRPLVQFQKVACIGPTPGNLGALFCRTAEPQGTEPDVLPIAGCESGYARADELANAVGVWFGNPTMRLFAVYRSGTDVFIVLSRLVGQNNDQPAGLVATARDGRLIGMQFGCGQTAEQFVASVSPQDFLLPPQ